MNQAFFDIFPSTEVHHLISQGSNHAPLHVVCNTEEGHNIKSLRFLNFWTKHVNYKEIVKQNWKVDFVGSPVLKVQAKMKRVKKALSE